jgi:glycosyltransferase involved in cell wall biosynthesis
VHHWLGTWRDRVNLYVTFTNFYRRKFIEHGFPSDRIVTKPHFVHPDPGPRDGAIGDYALFIGRLDPVKGIRTLIRAWQKLSGIPLVVIGAGSLAAEVRGLMNTSGMKVRAFERLPEGDLMNVMKGARFLLWTSEGYETFGLVAAEAFACGVPVIASGLEAMAETVQNERTGLHFQSGNADDLAAKVEWAWTHPREMMDMGREARREYEAKYTAGRNYRILMRIYDSAMKRARH